MAPDVEPFNPLFESSSRLTYIRDNLTAYTSRHNVSIRLVEQDGSVR